MWRGRRGRGCIVIAGQPGHWAIGMDGVIAVEREAQARSRITRSRMRDTSTHEEKAAVARGGCRHRRRCLHLDAYTQADGAILIADVAWPRIAATPVLVEVGTENVRGVEHHRNVLVGVRAQRE